MFQRVPLRMNTMRSCSENPHWFFAIRAWTIRFTLKRPVYRIIFDMVLVHGQNWSKNHVYVGIGMGESASPAFFAFVTHVRYKSRYDKAMTILTTRFPSSSTLLWLRSSTAVLLFISFSTMPQSHRISGCFHYFFVNRPRHLHPRKQLDLVSPIYLMLMYFQA